MTSPNTTETPPPIKYDFLGAILSYMVPGLGQITQGRVGKGLLFMVSLYSLFFYGWILGSKKNVYLPDYNREVNSIVGRVTADLYARSQFVGQFPIGMVAWPAIYQYVTSVRGGNVDPEATMATPTLDQINDLQRNGDKTWDLGWVYTVIAGFLNILVIYDALAGAAFRESKSTLVLAKPTGGETK